MPKQCYRVRKDFNKHTHTHIYKLQGQCVRTFEISIVYCFKQQQQNKAFYKNQFKKKKLNFFSLWLWQNNRTSFKNF